jgi:hypothetical protein
MRMGAVLSLGILGVAFWLRHLLRVWIGLERIGPVPRLSPVPKKVSGDAHTRRVLRRRAARQER